MTDPDPLVLDIVVYGIINAGKSSLINALSGRSERAVGPTGGTTADVVGITWHWAEALGPELADHQVRLIDTPGLDEVASAGALRGGLATDAASTADLILFVLAEDLTSTARSALVALHAAGKPMVVVVNKVDLLDDDARGEVVEAIRQSLGGLIPPENVVEAAAWPVVRRRVADETGQTVRVETVRGEPDVAALRGRLAAILIASREDLRALAVVKTEVDRYVVERDGDRRLLRKRAEWVADETSGALAIALAINPVPLLDFLTGPGGLVILIRRVADVYGEPMTADVARGLAMDLIRGGRVVLWGALATTIAGGAMKLLPGIGHLAGALSQGASAGYFGHVVGRALVTYLENGKDWGDGGLIAELDRVAAATDRMAITRGLVAQIKARLNPNPSRVR